MLYDPMTMSDDLATILAQIQESQKEIQRSLETTREDLRGELREGLASAGDQLRSEFRKDLASTRDELRSELRKDLATTRDEIRSDFNERFEDLHRHFDVVAEDLRSDIRLVAEGVVQNRETIASFKEQNAREHEELRSELRSMLRLSHSDLDRRLQTQEDRTDALEGRVDRLEAQA